MRCTVIPYLIGLLRLSRLAEGGVFCRREVHLRSSEWVFVQGTRMVNLIRRAWEERRMLVV